MVLCKHGRARGHFYQDTKMEVHVKGNEAIYRQTWCPGPVSNA